VAHASRRIFQVVDSALVFRQVKTRPRRDIDVHS
jgi:hypothetical protein